MRCTAVVARPHRRVRESPGEESVAEQIWPGGVEYVGLLCTETTDRLFYGPQHQGVPGCKCKVALVDLLVVSDHKLTPGDLRQQGVEGFYDLIVCVVVKPAVLMKEGVSA